MNKAWFRWSYLTLPTIPEPW